MNHAEHYEQLRQYKNYEIMQNTPTDEKAKKAFQHRPYDHMKGVQNDTKTKGKLCK